MYSEEVIRAPFPDRVVDAVKALINDDAIAVGVFDFYQDATDSALMHISLTFDFSPSRYAAAIRERGRGEPVVLVSKALAADYDFAKLCKSLVEEVEWKLKSIGIEFQSLVPFVKPAS